MKIDLSKICDDFNVTQRSIDGYGPVVLIAPSKSKHAWGEDELHLRSLLCTLDGEIVSSGFPKFKNFGEDPVLDRITEEAIANSNVYFAEKMDGSLIIRDIFLDKDGKPFVHFRTRGSHNLGEFHEPVMAMIEEKYPELLSTDIGDETSILFEYTSPDNRIIVQYDDSELTLLGGMKHFKNRLPLFIWGLPGDNANIAHFLGVRALTFFNLPHSVTEAANKVRAWSDSEGIVAWCDIGEASGTWFKHREIHMSKIKADDYIRRHSLKYAFNGNKLRKLCFAAGIESLDALRDALYEFGIDWETVSLLRPDFEEYISERGRREKEIRSFLDEYDASGIPSLETRKDIAIQTKEYCLNKGRKSFFSVCMAHAIGDTNKVNRNITAYSLDIPVGSLSHYREHGEALLEDLKPFSERFSSRFWENDS